MTDRSHAGATRRTSFASRRHTAVECAREGWLRVEMEYERAGGNVLDLGCLGPGGFALVGQRRESFVIACDAATPGYLPGNWKPAPGR